MRDGNQMPVNISMPSSGKTILLSLFDETGVSGGGELREAEQPTQLYFPSGPRRPALDGMLFCLAF